MPASEEALNMHNSPDGLTSPRKLNKVPMILIALILFAILAGVIYALFERAQLQERNKKIRETEHVVSNPMSEVQSLLRGAPDLLVGAHQEPRIEPEPQVVMIQPTVEPTPIPTPTPLPTAEPEPELSEHEKQVLAEKERIRQLKKDSFESALFAETSLEVDKNRDTKNSGNAQTKAQLIKMLTQTPTDGTSAADLKMALLQKLGNSIGQNNGKNSYHDQQESFLQREQDDGYLQYSKKDAINDFEIKTGTIIPAIMISGTNSDLPGQLIAQVSQNVYDSATGANLLIPQGTRLYGQYDSRVNYGQERVLINWNRLIFPDSSTLNIGHMLGADQAGYSGFSDQVDNHYFRIFGSAILMSVISAGYQLSQPESNTNDNETNVQETMAASLGQQLNQVGTTLTQKNLSIQPTLTIRPGYKFVVMVNKDMLFNENFMDKKLARTY